MKSKKAIMGLICFGIILIAGNVLGMTVTSTAYNNGANIPQANACTDLGGSNLSPQLSLGSIPAGTQAFALIMDDPDAPGGTFVHWLMYWNNAGITSMNQNSIPAGAVQGMNDNGTINYFGPCPPSNHRYSITIYALNAALSLTAGFTRSQLENAISGKTLANCVLLGYYPSGGGTSSDLVYFPHIASNSMWDSEVAIINPTATTVTGTLRPFGDSGAAVSTAMPVTLGPHGRRQVTIGQEFSDPDTIGYMLFESDSSSVVGYTKFYRQGLYRAAIPAGAEENTGDIFLTHVTSDPAWWTGVSLLNTSSQARTAALEFSDGTTINRNIAANEHQKFLVSALFGGQTPAGIASAVIKNAPGVIGLELFGSANQLEGIPATDESATTLYYPYVPNDPTWWAGMVAYNPSSTACTLTITGYQASGVAGTPVTRTLNGTQKLSALTSTLGLAAGTAWFKIEATSPITGFELIGTADWNQVGGFYGIGAKEKEGIFAKIEQDGGWTYLVLANTEGSQATVTLTAYRDSGTQVATTTFTLNGHAKVEQTAEEFFASQNISNATYIGFTSTKELVGLQLNGSSDNTMLDGLPGL
jgi:Raf kinase inhibitor-like YbhB/YbcL family protein